jgi:hypothetical protein
MQEEVTTVSPVYEELASVVDTIEELKRNRIDP